MRSDQITRIDEALVKGYDVIAGDFVEYHSPGGTITGLLSIMYDDERDSSEGLIADHVGLRWQGERELLFMKRYLDAVAVVFEPDGHFHILGEQWDFSEKEALKMAQVPIAGIQNMVVVRLRKSVELEQSSTAGEMTFEP